MLEQLVLFFIAFVANILSSLAGGGAGLLQLPALIFLGLPFPVALATHKIASVALGVGATLKHIKTGRYDFWFAGYILACGLPGVILGALWVLDLPERIAEIALGLLTLGLGVYSIFKPQLGQNATPQNRSIMGLSIGGIVLFAIGGLNGSLTSGTGLFVTLWLIRWFGLDYKQALAYTMVLVGFFWNATGALTLSLSQAPYWAWLPALLGGALLGGYFGAYIALSRGNHFIKRIFEGVTVIVGLALLLRPILQPH